MNRDARRRVVATSVAVLVLMGAVLAAPYAGSAAPREAGGQRRSRVSTASDEARAKIHPKLAREMAEAAPGSELQFTARIRPGTSLEPFAGRWFARPFVDPLGTTVAAGLATSGGLQKMAGLRGVIALQPAESIVDPPAPPAPEAAPTPPREHAEPAIRREASGSPGPAPTGWFHTTGAIHRSRDAWDKGYTGTGVRYMSNDSGADYCHPDLARTWAYIDDPSSPYRGLPEMFDSWSSFVAAFDHNLGTDFVGRGFADYADTSTVVVPQGGTGSRQTLQALYRPIGATAVRTYKLPPTSRTREYHIGSHPDTALAGVANVISQAFFRGAARAVRGERAGVLVVDENTPGVYDTVYVDLNYNFDFRDDRPARLTRDFTFRETACLDYDGDGLNDISGGLVYFISDGSTPVPTLDWFWGIPGSAYGNGDLVAFHVQDFRERAGNHGQGTTSVATGQGVVAGSVFHGPGGPPLAGGQGLVVGPGRDVRSTQNGNFYRSPFLEDAFIYAGLGYDGASGTGDDVQIMSNSWGISATVNDGMDFASRLVDSINRTLAPRSTFLFSTGNGAPGYGTDTAVSPASGIGVGASNLFDTVGIFDPIASTDQIVGGDPVSWSNRGPGVRNDTGPHVVATGSFGTGDLSLNEVLWGAVATAIFSGTSMAAPVAAGNLALIQQAWRDRTGEWPTFGRAKALLMGSARNVEHDVWSQGSGLVDADRGTDVAGGLSGVYATPPDWSAGEYRGAEHPAFANVIAPGAADEQTFVLHNDTGSDRTVGVSSNRFTRIGTDDYSFTTADQSLDLGITDYLLRLDEAIPPGTDLLQVRLAMPHAQFDPDEDLREPFSLWEPGVLDWTDVDGDGEFWVDANGNGKVDPDEMEPMEVNRFNYSVVWGPTHEARVGSPLERMTDGILLGLRHYVGLPEVPRTDFTIEVSYWRRVPWEWVSTSTTEVVVPAHGTATIAATLTVPPEAPLGMYEGAVVVDDGGREVLLPVTAAVAGSGTQVSFGGSPPQDALYDTGRLYGATDYGWRAESGDWRFFWTDVRSGDLPPSGTPYLVVDNAWTSPGTDIDTILLGPTPDPFSAADPATYGPYGLDPVAESVNTHIGRGRWQFQTSSGGPREVVAAPAAEGLHAVLLHQVRVDGAVLEEHFAAKAGLVTLDPAVIEGNGSSGEITLSVASDLSLDGFTAEGFGLGRPVTTRETALQDDPDDPSTASFVTQVTLDHAALLEVGTANSGHGSDIDLYVYGPDGGLIGASTTPTDEEAVAVELPEDGVYTVAVHGWSVPGGSDQFDLTINAVQGHDVSVTGAPPSIPAGGTAELTVAWDAGSSPPGSYEGVVLLGIEAAPSLLLVPVRVTVP